jgi:hypothetical protein
VAASAAVLWPKARARILSVGKANIHTIESLTTANLRTSLY